MRLIVNLFTYFAVINYNVRRVLTAQPIEDCSLLPSALGPDWYKVPRPVPIGVDGKPAFEPSYVHMPCAKTTVFDISVCGCTSLMSFIFTSVNRRKQIHDGPGGRGQVDPDDIIKRVDDSTTPRPPVGSLLINTRTGEVKECPFRASSRGPRWYLIREPRDHWINMICAAGTVFEKRRCTCVHKRIESREPEKPEDASIVIIEEDWASGGETISQSLGISVADVDFSADRRKDDIPFWRQQDMLGSNHKEDRGIFNGKSDVKVTLHNHEHDNQKTGELDIGKDKISDVHKDMFFEGSRVPVSNVRTKISPLVLDSNLHNSFDMGNKLHSDGNGESLLIHANKFEAQKPSGSKPGKVIQTNDILNVLEQISTKLDALSKDKITTALDNVASDVRERGKNGTAANGQYETIFYKTDLECSKKPVPELGPQYFLLNVISIGDIPFTCHGNAVYNDTVCACIPTKEDMTYDEATFPVTECTKKKLPELGPQYFLDHLLGVGYIPYVCHGDMVYDEKICACV